jgi:hypothetical protein
MATKKWIAAFDPNSNIVCLKGKQPRLVLFHELIHYIRYTNNNIDCTNQMALLIEELIAFQAGYKISKILNCPSKCEIYYAGWNNCKRLADHFMNEQSEQTIKLAANLAIKQLFELVKLEQKS